VDKTLQLTLKINADTSGLNKSLAGVGAGVKRVKVPVDLEASGEGLSKNIRVRLDGAGDDFGRAAASHINKATVKADFGTFVADQLANRIAKATGSAVEDAVRKGSKGDLLGAIGGLIGKAVSIPVQAVTGTAQAALKAIANGATATARTAFQGVIFGATQSASAELGQGINAGLQKAFGSTIGSPELIGRKLIEKLGLSISQYAGKAAEAVGVDLPKVGKAVRQNLGEQEVLTDSRAKSAEERQVKTQRKESAQVELNRERQEVFRTQAAAVESYAAITQSIERQSKELVKKNAETIRKLQAKLAELAAEAAQDTAEPVDTELVKAFQVEIRKAKTSLKEIQQARVDAGSEFEAAIASASTTEEKTDIKAQAKAYQVALRKELQGGFSNLLNELVAPAVELEQIQKEAKAKLDEAFAGSREARAKFAVVEGGEAYRATLEANAKVLDKQQIEIAERIQQQQQVLAKGLGIEAKLAAKVEAAPEAERDSLLALQAEAQRNINAIAKEINDLKSARTKITDEIAALADQARAIPQGPNKVVAGILKEFGAQGLSPEQVPQIQLATAASLKSTTAAQYLPELNVIQVRAELFDALQTATSALDLTAEQQRLIREEVFHSLQFGLGSLEGLDALKAREPLVKPAQIQPEEIKQAGRRLNYYAPDVQQIELEAKVAANRGTSATEDVSERKAQQQALFKKTGFGGVLGTEILNEALQAATTSVQGIEQRAKELGHDFDATQVSHAITSISTDLEKFANESLSVAAGEFDSAKILGISEDFERIRTSIIGLNASIAELSADFERQAAQVKQPSNIDHALAIVEDSSGAVSVTLDRLGAKLAPAANVVGGAIDYTTRGLVAVGKAGLALADKLGFAAASLIPGGALAYEPAKAAVKFAAPAVAAGALATQVPAAGEIISAISSAIGAILAPATSGLSASVGHAVSAEIAGALPSLFSALSHAVAESGLPGSQITAAAVDKLGGGLIHLLEPVISGVANTADSTILSVGHAVNEFLGEVGGLLLAGKGLQEGVKLATSEDARAGALKGVETIGSGLGQVVGGVQEGIQDAADAIDRTKRAVQQNIEGIKGAAERVTQGDISAVSDAVEETQAAVGNLTRGVQDVAKASTGAVQNVVEGAGKVVGVFGDLRSVKLPDGLNLVDLAQEQLIKIQQQLRQKLDKTLEAEAQGLPVIGGAAFIKKDLALVGQVLEAKYEVVSNDVAEQQIKAIAAAPINFEPQKPKELVPIEVPRPPELKKLTLDIEPVTVRVPADQVTVETPVVKLDISPTAQREAARVETAAEGPRPSFDELTKEVDRAIKETDREIKATYAYFSEQIENTKKAIKKGQTEAAAGSTAEAQRISKILANKISELQEEIALSLNLLEEHGIPTGPNTPLGDQLRKTKSALGQKARLIPERLASIPETSKPFGDEPVPEFQSLQSLDMSLVGVEDVLRDGATSLSKALKKLVEAVFEVQGDTLKQSLALAATSPRAQDLAVNVAGLAASSAVADHGQVAQLAADLTGALAARQALGGGGAETFGDITGFIAGNAANKLTGIPGSGAVAASLVVPQLQKLRDQIQAKYGQPLDIEVPVDLQFEGLQSINSEVAKGHQQVEQIEVLLAELRQLEAEGKLVTPTVGERISGFLSSISRAFAKADTGEIAAAIAKIETELARAGNSVSAQLSEEAQKVDQEAEQLTQQVDKATGRIESSLYEFKRVEEKIDDQVLKAQSRADVIGGAPQVPAVSPQSDPQTEGQKTQQRLLQLEAERQRRITELDGLIASETARIGDEKAEQIVSLKRQRANLERPTQQYQAEDLGQFVTPKATVNPTNEERGVGARQRLERDASERDINAQVKSTLKKGTPTPSLEENQIAADSAIASFDKNFSKFNATAEQIESGSTRAQKALRSVGEGVTTFRQKLDDAGGISGVLGKVGQSLSHVAEKAGLPVNTIGKLGNIIKGVGIAALAYVGVTQLGDAIVQLGQKAFETYSKVELLQKRLKFVGGGDSALQEDLAFIRKESERLKIPVNQLTESFAALRIATKGTTIEGGKTKEFASALGTLSRVYGLTAEQAQSVQYQLGQTIRLGRAQGDELRSISDAGINIQQAIGDSLGKSGAEVAALLEKGQISADQTVDALIRLAEQAKSGLPDALTAASVSVDTLKKEFVDVALVVGEKTAPLVVAGVSAIGGGIKLLEQAAKKLSPVFDAIGNGVGLLLDIASPIVGVIGAIALAIGGDLLDGIAIPFQAINAGLIEIRGGFTAVAGVAVQALSAIGEQAAALGVNIPFLGEIIKYANPATIAVRLLGAAIGAFLVGSMIRMGVAIGGVVIPALIGMAGTMTATVIPAIGAAITASLAFIATPLGATIAAIGIIAAVAAPHMDELANSISGLGDAQVKANDRATKFNNDYQKSLGQLQKGIPLTVEELKNLKDGFQQNVAEGKDTAETAAKLSANLDRMQASAEAAAQIQAKLTKAMADATKAIKLQSQAIDAGYSTRLAGLNESLANQQITRERFDQEELAAQGEKSGKYLALYQTQGDNLRSALAEANARLAAPLPDATRTEVKKQVETLQDQIYEIEQKGGEQRIALAQNRVKVTEGIEKDRAKRAENEIKTLENQLAAGTTAQVEIEHKISQTKQQETERRIKEIDRQLKTEVSAGGKVSEISKNLYSERAVLESELSRIVSEEATKRYDILLKEMEKSRDRLSNAISEAETEANIELQNAQNAGLLKQAEVEAKRTNLTRTRLQKDLALELASVETLQSLPSPTDPEKAEEHQKRIREGKLKTAQIVQQIAENEYKRQESIRNLAAKALDEQVKGAENAATAIEQIGKLASNALERQNKILEAQKSLRASIVSLHDEEFKILIETETNERDKANLQEKAAKFRLDSLKQSQALEERILEIQLAQEKVQNRVAIIKAQAALAKAEAEQAKVNANPESTDADKQAAALGVKASQIELGGTIESARLQEGLGDYKRQQSKVNNQKELLGAKFEYAKAIVDPLDRRDAIERIQAEAARGLRERNQDLLPIGNRRGPLPDYSQLDSASQQLGLTPKGVNLGRFIPPAPVNLHAGAEKVGALGVTGQDIRSTMATIIAIQGELQGISNVLSPLGGQLMGLANRPQVIQNIHNKTTKRTEPGFAGLPL
jgi:tape measure domain-containing protein